MTSTLSEDSTLTAALPSPIPVSVPLSLTEHEYIVNKETEDKDDFKVKEPLLALQSKTQIDMDKRCGVDKTEFMLGLGLKTGSKNLSEESLPTPVPVQAPALDLEHPFAVDDQGQGYFLKPPTVISNDDANLKKDRAENKKRKMPINSSDDEADKEISGFFTVENEMNAAKKQHLRMNHPLRGFKSASNSDENEDPMPIAMKCVEIPLSRMPELKKEGRNSSSDTDTSRAPTVEINIPAESGVKAIELGPEPEAHHHRLQETSKTFPIQCVAQLPTFWGSIAIGEWVFARWSDKNYYSGQIVEKGLNDTWKIYYYDHTVAAASEAHILPIKIIGVNTKAVYSPDHMYYPTLAKVVSQKIFKAEEPETVEYVIECASPDLDRDDEPRTITCNRRQLCLKESEVKVLRRSYQASIRKTADLSEHNILAGSRRRRRVAGNLTKTKTLVSKDSLIFIKSNPLSGSGSGVSGDRNNSRRNLVQAVSMVDLTNDDDDDESDNSMSTRMEPLLDLETSTSSGSGMEVDVKPEWNLFKWKGTSISKASKAMSHSAKGEADTSLFQDFQFFITASAGCDASKKEAWKEVITSRKGTVLDSVRAPAPAMKEVKRGEEKVLLISNVYARTEKYIFCLAAGIPCVCHTWLDACLEKNGIVGWEPYQLNHGWSLEDECVIKPHGEKPLKNMCICITAAEDTSLYNVFNPVLTAAEALVTLLSLPALNDAAAIDTDAELDEGFESQGQREIFISPDTQVVITDSTCPDDIHRLVIAKKIPIVRAEWVVQSIITGKVAPFNGHVKYEF